MTEPEAFRFTTSAEPLPACAVLLPDQARGAFVADERTLIRKQADPRFESDRTIIGQPIDDAAAAHASVA